MLKDNLIEVEEHIKKACEKSGRNPEDVCLVAVSKTKPKDMLMEVYDCDMVGNVCSSNSIFSDKKCGNHISSGFI